MAALRKGKKGKEQETAATGDYRCLRAPVITEKSSALQGGQGASTYAFYVDRRADKGEIRRAVERVFNVEVAAVRVCNTWGKLKRTTRAVGLTTQRKKAYVTLKPGKTIDIIEGV